MSAPTMSASIGGKGSRTIQEDLRRRLLALEYEEFAGCVCRLLEALGYEEARLSGRREWKGYNRPGGGGWDAEATLPGGLSPRRVVAQIKQFDALPVHQRQVDELRGAALRAGAAEALLVTTSAFSDVVRANAAPPDSYGTQVAPVRLIDGEELTGLMVRHRLGVRESGRGGKRGLEIDQNFFDGPSARSGKPAAPERPAPATWRVTVRVVRGSCSSTRRSGRAEGGR